MVDALRRARDMLVAGGVVVDIHPTPEPAHLDVASGSELVRIADRIDDGSATGPRGRHLAADNAVETCVSRGIFAREAATEFTFQTCADNVAELLHYLTTKWKQLHFAEADLSRAHALVSRRGGDGIVVTERIRAQRLRR
jgi:hypothetical protein